MINVRHILISPKFSSADLKKAQLELDSIKNQIASGKITFEEAALKFSDDTETKLNGGLLINPATGTTKGPGCSLLRCVKKIHGFPV
jgi:peptidyl-prolyl cis-trans isomerase SurA